MCKPDVRLNQRRLQTEYDNVLLAEGLIVFVFFWESLPQSSLENIFYIFFCAAEIEHGI